MDIKRQPSVAIDLDGVIGDFVGCFRLYLESNYGVDLDIEKLTDPNLEAAMEKLLPNHNLDLVWQGFWQSSEYWFLRMEPYPKVREALQRLLDAGFEVIILTSRWLSVYKDTNRWLWQNQIPHTAVIMGTNKTDWLRSQARSHRPVRMFVEDLADKANAAAKGNPSTKVYLISRPWNDTALVSDIARVPDLDHAVADFLGGVS